MTQTNLCNLALAKLGSFTITSIDENSAEARHCKINFDLVRQSLLREFDFNFSVAWVLLSQIADGEAFDFNYAYQLPEDYLRILSFDGAKAGTKQYSWQMANGVIYSNQSEAASAKLEYIRDVTDCTEWDATFCAAFVWYLAAAICPAIKQDPKMAVMLLQAGQAFLNDAKGTDTQEDTLRVISGPEHSVYQQARSGRFTGSPNFLLADWGPPQ